MQYGIVPHTTGICVCMCACVCMFVHVRTRVRMHVFICMYVCMCCRRRYVHYGILFPILQVCVFVRVHVYVCLFTYGMHMYACDHMYVCLYVCRRRYMSMVFC